MREDRPAVHLLVVEDDEEEYTAIRDFLTSIGRPEVTFSRTITYDGALESMRYGGYDLYLIAGRLNGDDGIALLREARSRGYREPALILLDDGGDEATFAALDAGAAGTLHKAILSAPLLARAIHYAVRLGRSEAARRESEERYQHLFTNMLEGMALHEMIYDEEGSPVDYTILEVNQRFEETLAIRREETVGQRATAVYDTPEAPYLDVYARVAATGEPIRFETYFPPMDRHFSISVFSPGPGRFATVFRDISEQKRASRQIQEHAARAEALARVAARLNARLDLDMVLQAICEETARALGVDAVSVMLYDERGERLHFAASLGLPVDFDRRALPVPRATYEKLVPDKGKPIAIPDVRDRDDLVNAALFAALDVRTLVVATLERNGNLIGGLNIKTLGEVRAFTEDELALSQGIADQATQAISNARLLETATRRLQRLRALNAIDRAILTRMRMQDTLDVILEQVLTHLAVDAAGILLLDTQSETLQQVGGMGFRDAAFTRGRLRLGEGYAGRAAQERRTIHVADLSRAGDFVRSPVCAGERFVSYSAVPLLAGDAIKGVLDVYHRRPFQPTPEWQDFLEAVAAQAAIAIHSAQLSAKTRRLMRQIRRQTQQVRQIIDTLPEGVMLLNVDHQMVLANPIARKFLPMLAQLSADNAITRLGDRPAAELLQPERAGTLWEEVNVSGPDRIFQVGVRALKHDSSVGGWVVVMRDVTEERRRQEHAHAQERLATVGQLAAGIAHDFNNIMAVITLYSESLERDPDMAQRRDYAGIIRQQARHASNLIAQILDFSRASVMERIPVNLTPFVKEAVKLLQRTLPATVKIELVLGDEQRWVKADPSSLQQAIMNLTVNARDAMPAGGELTITLDRVRLEEGQRPPVPEMAPGEWVRLAIADTGTGIAPDDLPHIFEPFYTTKQRGKGAGLGLAQVYGIVKQHDGEIVVDSGHGARTTFTIYLPTLAEGGAEGVPHPEKPEPLAAGEETILVVEDNAEAREAIREVLGDLGYQVLTAENGRQALALFDEVGSAIDLVLSDMVMPEMGGQELYDALRARWPQTSVVLMSGYPLGQTGKPFVERSNVAWIRKPFTVAALGRKLRQVLDAEVS